MGKQSTKDNLIKLFILKFENSNTNEISIFEPLMAKATRFLGTPFSWKDIYQANPIVPTVLLFIYATSNILNPSLRILIAELTSLSWWVWQQGQSHSRIERFFVSLFTYPHTWQVWELA